MRTARTGSASHNDGMDSTTIRQQIIDGLISAWQSGQRWRPAAFEPALADEDAYAIQAEVAARMGWLPQGQRAWKVGGYPRPSAAALPQLLASPAQWHPLFGDAVLVEAELALRLERRPASAAEVPSCVGSLCVAIEIVDTRIEGGLQAPAGWKLADQSVNASLVCGDWMDYRPYAGFAAADWSGLGCRMQVNGELARQARGTHPNQDPLCALPWLFDHALRHGDGLRAGDIVTTGAWIALPASPGERVEVEFDGLPPAVLRIEG